MSVFQDLPRHAERRVDRDREPDAFRVGNRRRVDRHDSTLQVDEGPATVARIHRGIRLNHRKPISGTEREIPPERADHARRDRRPAGKAQRIPDREDRLADLQLVGIRELRGVKVLSVHLDDRDVGLIVSADDRTAQDPAVRERHDHLARAVDHVVRREDVPCLAVEDARADSPPRPRSPERRAVRGPCRAHVGRADSHPLDRVDVRVLQVCNHGDRNASAGFVERVLAGPVTVSVGDERYVGRSSPTECGMAGAGHTRRRLRSQALTRRGSRAPNHEGEKDPYDQNAWNASSSSLNNRASTIRSFSIRRKRRYVCSRTRSPRSPIAAAKAAACMSLARTSMSSARNVPPLKSESFWRYAKIASCPRWSPETSVEPGTCHTASSAMSFFRDSLSPASKAAYSPSTRAAFGCSNIPIPSPRSRRRSAVLGLKAFAHHVRSHVLQEPELVPARILEDYARAGRDLEGSTCGLPPARSEFFGLRLEVLHLEERQDGGSRSVVREQKLGAVAQPKGGHLRAERVLVPDELRAQDLRVILQVPLEIGGADVKVEELAERGGHGAT